MVAVQPACYGFYVASAYRIQSRVRHVEAGNSVRVGLCFNVAGSGSRHLDFDTLHGPFGKADFHGDPAVAKCRLDIQFQIIGAVRILPGIGRGIRPRLGIVHQAKPRIASIHNAEIV